MTAKVIEFKAAKSLLIRFREWRKKQEPPKPQGIFLGHPYPPTK